MVVKAREGQERGGGHNFPSILSKTGVPDVFPSGNEVGVLRHFSPSECLTHLRDSDLRVGR